MGKAKYDWRMLQAYYDQGKRKRTVSEDEELSRPKQVLDGECSGQARILCKEAEMGSSPIFSTSLTNVCEWQSGNVPRC